MSFNLIVACTLSGGIGMNNALPWNLPQDMKNFYKLTVSTFDPLKSNAVIMGRKTWESLPKRLNKRINVVISSTLTDADGMVRATSLDDALKKLEALENVETIFVIGGSRLYQDAICHEQCQHAYVTWIHKQFECDAFFPVALFNQNFTRDNMIAQDHCENDILYSMTTYQRATINNTEL